MFSHSEIQVWRLQEALAVSAEWFMTDNPKRTPQDKQVGRLI